MNTPRAATIPLLGAVISTIALTAPSASAFLLEDGTFETVLSSFNDGVGWEAFGTPDAASAIGREDWANGAPGTGALGYGLLGDGQFGLVFKGFTASAGGFFHDVAVDPAKIYAFHIQSHAATNMFTEIDTNGSLEINFEWYDGDPTASGALLSTTPNNITALFFDGGSDADNPAGPTDSTNWDDWDFAGLTPPAGSTYVRVIVKWTATGLIVGGDDVIRWDNAQLTHSTPLAPLNESTGTDTVPRVSHTTQAGLVYNFESSKNLVNFADTGFPTNIGDGTIKDYFITRNGDRNFYRANGAINNLLPDKKVVAAGLAAGDADWQGFMNVSNLPAPDGDGMFVFGGVWGIDDLVSDVSATTNTLGSQITLSPNTIGDVNEFWYQNTSGTAPDPTNPGGPGQLGNKIMEANLFYTYSDTILSGQTVTFTGNVASNSFTSAHAATVFIKDFAADFSSFTVDSAPLDPGPFSLSLATDPGAGRHIQFGFTVTGENVWVTDTAPFGTVVIDIEPLTFSDDEATIDEGTANTLEWDGESGIYYVTEYSDDAGANWFPLMKRQFLGTGTRLVAADPSGVVPGRTYRAIAAPPVPTMPAS